MEPWRCLCWSLDFTMVEQTSTTKTWRCATCRTRFTLERVEADWRLYHEGSLLGSGLPAVAALFGRDREEDVAEFFASSVMEVTAATGKRKLPPPQEEAPEEAHRVEPDPDLAFLKSLGSNVPRRYAHLLSPEDLERKSEIYWPSTATHLLAGSIPDAREFIPHVAAHVAALAEFPDLDLAALDYSVASADLVDAALQRDRPSWLSGDRFRGLVAYAGETIREQLGGSWTAEYNPREQWWEPYVRDTQGRLYNPWLRLYKGLLEGEAGSFVGSVGMEIQSSPGWKPRAGGW